MFIEMPTLLYMVVLVRIVNLVLSQYLIADSGGPIIFTTLSNAMLTLRVLAVYNYNRYRKWTLTDDLTCNNYSTVLVFSICLVIGAFAGAGCFAGCLAVPRSNRCSYLQF